MQEFTVELFERIRRDLRANKLGGRLENVDCILVGDSEQVGLRARIHRNDPISLWVRYTIGELPSVPVRQVNRMVVVSPEDIDVSGPYLKIGELPDMTIE